MCNQKGWITFSLFLRLWVSALLGTFLGMSQTVHAMAKKAPLKSEPTDGKRVVALEPTTKMVLELPDGTVKDFGEGFHAGLVTGLTNSGLFIVTDPHKGAYSSLDGNPDYQWPGSVTPAASVRVDVQTLSYQTGSGGGRMLYGYDERSKVPESDSSGGGIPITRNEFPTNPNSYGRTFGMSFERRGAPPFDSQAGLDLGDGFSLDILFAWLKVKYARYHAEAHLNLKFDLPFGAGTRTQLIQVTGDGFFFDVAGAYQEYSGAITIARKDAMEQSVRKALAGSFKAIQDGLKGVPLMTMIDGMDTTGNVFLGTGPSAQVKAGVLFQSLDIPELVIQVNRSVTSGAIGLIKRGRPSQVRARMVLKQVPSMPPLQRSFLDAPSVDGLSRFDSVALPSENLPQTQLPGVTFVSRIQAFFKSLVEGIFLGYRMWRYSQYDQKFYGKGVASGAGALVAVIDSGIDYNHSWLREHIWVNPEPFKDSRSREDRTGWDFISGDARAYDDAYHGTEMASAVSAISKGASLMPLKVFNPWGLTSSTAVYSAFVYAVDHGASLILCGWATTVKSKALEMGIAYAHKAGVLVVTPAGDDGNLLSRVPLYPAAFAKTYDNVLVVTALDEKDQLLKEGKHLANYDPVLVGMATRGLRIGVAEPREQRGQLSSTDVASALVAGGVAELQIKHNIKRDPRVLLELLAAKAAALPGLKDYVRGGLRLKLVGG